MKMNPIYRIYNSLFIAMILLGIMFISGCSGGGTEVGNPASQAAVEPVPSISISNLIYSHKSSTNNETGGEEITLTGSVNFVDDDGNISHLIIDIIDSNNNQVEQITEPIEGFSGQTSGTVEFSFDIGTEYTPGDYIFEIYIMDEKDNESNVLKGTLSVMD